MAEWTRRATDDPVLEEIQDRIAPNMRVVESNPLNKGVLLRDKTVNGETDILHGLGRAPLGWFITRQKSYTLIKDDQDSNKRPEKTLRLVSASSVTIDLWVF